MAHNCKKLLVMVWKSLVLRKRNWLLTIFEFISPILVVTMTLVVKMFMESTSQETNTTQHIRSSKEINIPFTERDYSTGQFSGTTYIAYAPKTALIKEIMKNYTIYTDINKSSYNRDTVEAKKSKAELEWSLRQHLRPNSSYSYVFGVLFTNPVPKRNISEFGYKIISALQDSLEDSVNPLTKAILLKLQVYLDSQILKLIGSPFWNTKVIIGEFINNKNDTNSKVEAEDLNRKVLLLLFYILITFAYLFLVTDLVRDTVQEKSSGIKEMMRIMGLPSWMIWFHWFTYTMLVQLPVTIVMTVILTTIPPLVLEMNGFVLWVLFLLLTVDYIMIFFFITCFIDSPTKGTILCSIVWIFINFGFIYFINPKKHGFLQQVLICFFPMINFCWAVDSIHSFQDHDVEWNFTFLFQKGYSGSEVSAGLGIIIFITEIIVFALLLAYFDAVKPGHYGVAKSPAFVFSWCLKWWHKEKQTPDSDSLELPEKFELPPAGTKVGIKIRGLSKTFGVFKKFVAVKCVNLDIYENEITVLLGHNGAGKTTTMSMITGLFSPSKGTIIADGENIYDNLFSYRQNLGLCTQHNLYFPKLTVIEHLIFFGMLKGSSYSQAKKEGIYLLHVLNMFDKKDFRGSKLSGGMQRRLCLGVSLMGNPKVLILDEPTSGLDPENRRHIWDLILGLRGERTILITTHYMEEADVLGDRIAIMDHGQVVCCGTTMFLKKLYGTGYSVHVSKKPDTSVQEITQLVRRHIPKFGITIVSQSQVDYQITDEFVQKLPNFFSDLESFQNNITGISVSCSTMEDVFLRVAELSEENKNQSDKPKESTTTQNQYEKLTGLSLYFQRFEAIVIKRLIYIYRKVISKVIKLIIMCLIIVGAILIANHYYDEKATHNAKTQTKTRLSLPLHSTYPFIFDNMNRKTAELAKLSHSNKKEQVFLMKLDNSSTVYEPLKMIFMKYLEKYVVDSNYSSKTPFPVTFIGNYSLLQYESLEHPNTLPITAANLINYVPLKQTLQIVNTNEKILPLSDSQDYCDFSGSILTHLSFFVFLLCALTILMSDLIPLLMEERVTGFKYQQIIAGISPFFYLVSNFVCDFSVYLITIVIWLVIISIFGSDVLPWSSEHMQLLILVLFLHGVSSLLFLNVFILLSKSAAVINSLYIAFIVLIALICPIVLKALSYHFDIYVPIILAVVLCLHPSCAMVIAIDVLSSQVGSEAACPRDKNKSLLSVPTKSNPRTILISLILMIFDSILYFCISLVVDYKLFAVLTHKTATINEHQEGDNDVVLEAQRVRMFKEEHVDTKPLRVEGLVKEYGKFRAANQVSFLVSEGECFGLLGVNGAGKTTTFKMLTGEITPTSGDAFATKYSVVTQTQKYLSHIGYCPQFDALLNDLTGKDILTIIAKIRGIPRNEVGTQVSSWMINLGIEEHAKKRTEAYSGGTKRKLSTAMAFIGDPEVVLLDEPTTGVDPAARRKVWKAVQDRNKAGYSAVLTSHSMEECEALCTRLTIMRSGQLCCIGSVQQLKAKFGQGFVAMLKLSLDVDNFSQLDKLKAEVLRIFPKSTIQDENPNMITFRILNPKTPWSRLFYEMLRLKEKYSIVDDFIVSSATLEQMFLAIARGQEIYSNQANIKLSDSEGRTDKVPQ